MTLVELLVVVSIMMLLAAYILPRLELNGEGRRIREAARLTSVFMGSARARAIENGRPVGVLFEPIDELTPGSAVLRQVEVPPLYAGDTMGAVMMLQDWTVNDDFDASHPIDNTNFRYYDPSGRVILKALVRLGDFSPGLLRLGDRVQFNGQGPWYEICDDPRDNDSFDLINNGDPFPLAADNTIDFSVGTSSGGTWIDSHWLTLRQVGPASGTTPWPKWPGHDFLGAGNMSWPAYASGTFPLAWSAPVSFQIQRQPVPTVAPPLVLPGGTAVDFTASGKAQDFILASPRVDTKQFFGDEQRSAAVVAILFAPTGAVDRLYWTKKDGTLVREVVGEPVYFLVGKRLQIEVTGSGSPTVPPRVVLARSDDANEEAKANWQLLSSRWVGVNPQTGVATVSENATTPEFFRLADPSSPDFDGTLSDRRLANQVGKPQASRYVQEAVGMGGAHQ
ncbi:MAG: hypothetical protein JW809_09405 [Pirellulales bacterium]|nr:hypothetical protein [Pirellulales bacterium]